MHSGAARKRLQREREKDGLLVNKVVLTWADIDLLIDLAALAEWDEREKRAVALAIPKALATVRDIFAKLDLLDVRLTNLLSAKDIEP